MRLLDEVDQENNMKLFDFIFANKQEELKHNYRQPRGFLDFDTGRRIEIDPMTRKEHFV